MQTATYFQKLWDKGIDITASVVTAVIVGAIGLLLWKGKLWLDLRAEEAKRRQQYRLDDERTEGLKRKAAIERAEAMVHELDEIISSAETVPNLAAQHKLWERYSNFMRKYDLDTLQGNAALLAERRNWDVIMGRGAANMPGAGPQQLDLMTTLLKKTQVPTKEG